ncbi:hypothetical protein PAL_GLEAN10022917 [Pteropus alecto]|uniref:NELL2-interacting cell ontogeny regulator 1 n=1 Tax=Pteropus alecto TaxID=9402 RepID=L5K723_PTEAL|nr:hypothetical protein PAL_GLEAN10022917 [Pteropus alecto]
MEVKAGPFGAQGTEKSALQVVTDVRGAAGHEDLELQGWSSQSRLGKLAEGRPCVDCHAFEFMQRALQDLRKTAYSLDARTETLLLQAERRALCACWPAGR